MHVALVSFLIYVTNIMSDDGVLCTLNMTDGYCFCHEVSNEPR